MFYRANRRDNKTNQNKIDNSNMWVKSFFLEEYMNVLWRLRYTEVTVKFYTQSKFLKEIDQPEIKNENCGFDWHIGMSAVSIGRKWVNICVIQRY